MTEETPREVALTTMEAMLEVQLQSVRHLLGKESHRLQPVRRTSHKRQSLVDMTLAILADEGCPVHVNDLVEMIESRFGRVTDRDSLSSALSKKVRQGVLLKRTASGTFATR